MELILNTVVIIFLCLTISYCWLLNKKIQEVKNSKKDIQEYLNNLNRSIATTNDNIQTLKTLSEETTTKLTKINAESEELAQDLCFINERSKNILQDINKKLEKKTVKTVRKKTTK